MAPAALVNASPPAGKVWVIRNIVAVADGSASQAVAGIYAPVPTTIAVAVQAPGATTVFTADTRVVVLPGETLRVQAVTGTWHVTVTGYEFDS